MSLCLYIVGIVSGNVIKPFIVGKHPQPFLYVYLSLGSTSLSVITLVQFFSVLSTV